MDPNMKSIIDKHDISENGMFCLEDVQNIIKDRKKTTHSSSTKRNMITSACVLVAAVSAMHRASVRSNNHVTYFSAVNVEDNSIRHLQDAESPFADWVGCDGVATVPTSYMNGGDDSSIIYICKPTQSTYGCDDVTLAPATVTTPPTNSSHPSEIISASPSLPPSTGPTLVTNQPSATTTLATGDTCYNQLGLDFAADPKHSCEWLFRFTDRKLKLCGKREDIRQICPVTCGLCCGDNPNFAYSSAYGEKTCAMVAADPNLANTLCLDSDVNSFCAKTCNSCPDYISMRPSTSGTTNETDAPTDRLDDD